MCAGLTRQEAERASSNSLVKRLRSGNTCLHYYVLVKCNHGQREVLKPEPSQGNERSKTWTAKKKQ